MLDISKSSEFQKKYSLLETNVKKALKLKKNLIITGKSGTGKTYLLNQLFKFIKKTNNNIGIHQVLMFDFTHPKKIKEFEKFNLSEKKQIAIFIDEYYTYYSDKIENKIKDLLRKKDAYVIIATQDLFHIKDLLTTDMNFEIINMNSLFKNLKEEFTQKNNKNLIF